MKENIVEAGDSYGKIYKMLGRPDAACILKASPQNKKKKEKRKKRNQESQESSRKIVIISRLRN
jgi:hypothetical protein